MVGRDSAPIILNQLAELLLRLLRCDSAIIRRIEDGMERAIYNLYR